MRYASDHPNKGSSAIATALEIPRGRIRPWLDNGSKPDPVRGIEIARDHGWLDASYHDQEFQALNVLVANVFSGGSIRSDAFQPAFALNNQERHSHVIDALEATGLEYEFHHEDDPNRATEVRPTDGATVLGRTLATLGAPVGPRIASQDSDLRLLSLLSDTAC